MHNLTVTLIQSDLHWQSTAANLAMFEEKIWQIEKPTDLIVLPEMFNTGFSMETEHLAEPMNFTSFKCMKQMAAQTKAVVTGSIIIKENGEYFNRLIWMRPDGNFFTYDKRHLFRMADEHNHFSMGQERLITEVNGWRICPLICYDLRFPVWSRNRTSNGTPEYDLLIYIANWPAGRVVAWDALLKARAIENLAYSIGVNRIGKNDKNIEYNGHSAVFGPKGNVIVDLGEKEEIQTVKLSMEELVTYRKKFPAYLDADEFQLK